MAVSDVMNRAPVAIGTGSSLMDALVLMRTHDVRGLPVTDAGGNLVGVLSQKDLARRIAMPVDLPEVKGLLDILMASLEDPVGLSFVRLRKALSGTTVGEAMSHPPFVVHADAPLELAMTVMAEQRISRLPVVEKTRLVGIVTPTDLISAALRRAPGAR